MLCIPLEILQWTFYSLAYVDRGYWRTFLHKGNKRICSHTDHSREYLLSANFNHTLLVIQGDSFEHFSVI